MNTTYTQKQLAEDLYDLIKELALPDNQDDAWAKLSRKHGNDARKNIKKYIRSKNMEWNGNTVKIGKRVTITVTIE